MHIQILKENLLRVFQVASRFSAQKTQLPILSHLAIFAEKDGIYVIGSDIDRSVKLRLAGKVIEKGSFSVPAKLLSEFTQILPLGAVDINVGDNESLMIKAGKVKASLRGSTTEEYPRTDYDVKGYFELGEFKIKDWQWVLDRLYYSVSKDDSRPILTGLLWDFKSSVLAATDGYRLSVVRDKLLVDRSAVAIDSIIIPGTLLFEAVRVMDEAAVEKMQINYHHEKKELVFVSEDVLVVGRVLEGEYPKYEAIIPESFGFKARMSRDELLQAVKIAAIFARESAHIVTLTFNGKGLEVSANAPQVGDNVVGVDCNIEEGKGVGVIAFNSKYLIDFLSAKGNSEVVFGMSESLQPGLFVEGKRDQFKHVIMPVRVKKED